MPDNLEERKKNIKEKLKIFFKDKQNTILVIILLFAAILRVKYIFIDQAAWWDAADYLTFAKIIGGKIVNYAAYDFNPRRPFFLALVWGMLYRLGFNEIALQFTEFLFSMGIVFLTYLLGKELYNKTIGLIASFIMSGFYMVLFYTPRLMTDIPSVFFLMLTMYYFLKTFSKEESNKKYAMLTGVSAGLAILTRAASIFTFPFFFVFLLIIYRLKIFKNKKFWIAIVIGLIIFSPFLIFVHFKHGGDAIGKFLGISYGRFSSLGARENKFEILFNQLEYVPLYLDANTKLTSLLVNNAFLTNLNILDITLKSFFLILFLFGFLYLSGELILGFDLVNKNDKLKNHLFVLLWFLIPLIVTGIMAGLEDRYIMIIFPAAFIMISVILLKLYQYISKYNKILAIFIVGFMLLFGIYTHVTYGRELVESKQMSYYPVKLAGLWIKENSNPEDKIVSASIYQNMYYSERDTYTYYNGEEKMTEKEFDLFIQELKPKYLVISVFEPGFTPEWVYTYPERHKNIKPIQVYYIEENKQQPALVIYDFISYTPSN